jgi:hypothetical protein
MRASRNKFGRRIYNIWRKGNERKGKEAAGELVREAALKGD